jgi:pilus assembly protein FimV
MAPMVSTFKIIRLHPVLTQCARGVLLSLCLLGVTDSNAVTLNRPLIQSVVGEPLAVEISLSNISDEELVDLQASLADFSVYKANGIPVNTALEDAKLELITREDTTKFIRITGVHPVSDPYVEVEVDLKWATGSILRNFGLFLGTQSINADSKTIQTPHPVDAQIIEVKTGDTAGKIALQNMDKSQLSLDQMLVALLNSNPDAFIQKNVNLVKAGASLKIPSIDEALAVETDKAHSEVVLQAKAFASYRSNLAAHLPQGELQKSEKSVTGKVSGKVKDALSAPKDQLKLSSPEVQSNTTELPNEEKIAQQKQAEVNTDRRQDLIQNIEDLSKLAQGAGLQVKDGMLSGLPDLAKINNLDDLRVWINDNFELVYVSSFVLGCIFLLWIWIRITKEPKKAAKDQVTPDQEGTPPSFKPLADELSSSPVFAPLPEQSIQDLTYEDVAHAGTPHLGSANPNSPHTQPISFDFDLNISSDPPNEAFTRQAASPVLTPISPSTNAPPAHTQSTSKASAPTNDQSGNSAEQEDPFRVRLDLAEELWKLGQKHTGRALAQEVAEQANEHMQEIAKRWLSEHP